MKHAIAAFLSVLSLSTGACVQDGYGSFGKPVTHYRVDPDETTPGGIRVDTSGFEVDLVRLDALTVELEACLVPILTDLAPFSIDRGGYDVKIPPDWFEENGLQGFPCDYYGKCAGVVQPQHDIIVPPNLAAYKHELIHLVINWPFHDNPAFACQ
jgi:hypothetical protein